uniref:NADH dehydrogenase subunit 6 n=1 Tax=Ditylenchus dipsaci TaxID=166011 RepID=A0A915E8Y5_9BILA
MLQEDRDMVIAQLDQLTPEQLLYLNMRANLTMPNTTYLYDSLDTKSISSTTTLFKSVISQDISSFQVVIFIYVMFSAIAFNFLLIWMTVKPVLRKALMLVSKNNTGIYNIN